MNDTELDEMLNQWEAPPAPAALRAKVRAGFSGKPPRRRWIEAFAPRKIVWLGTALGAGAFLCIVALAFPQTFTLSSPPYTVESRCRQFGPGGDMTLLYPNDGSPVREMTVTSFSDKGNEIVLSRSIPGNQLGTVAIRVGDAVASAITRFTWPVFKTEQLEIIRKQAGFSTGFGHFYLGSTAELLRNGCVNGRVVGDEMILGHATTAVQHGGGHYRFTLWRAPDLGCFPLKVTLEKQQPDGDYVLETEKQAIKVTFNH